MPSAAGAVERTEVHSLVITLRHRSKMPRVHTHEIPALMVDDEAREINSLKQKHQPMRPRGHSETPCL